MIKVLQRNSYLQQIYFRRSELDKVLMWSCLFSITMVAARIVHTRDWLFATMIWNLFLAYLPYLFSQYASRHINRLQGKGQLAAIVLIWLLFIPNSFYIITDLFHLKERHDIPFWFDLALLFSFAWNGLILGVLSIRHMEKLMEQRWSLKNELIFIYPVMFLNALGIFIGRYWRFNSWDVVTNPLALVRDMADLLLHPVHYRFDWSMIVCFSVLMTLLYSTLKRISKAVS